mgnify:CR=1 FL=1
MENGVGVRTGGRDENVPGDVIAIPDDPGGLGVEEVNLETLRDSYLRQAITGGGVA